MKNANRLIQACIETRFYPQVVLQAPVHVNQNSVKFLYLFTTRNLFALLQWRKWQQSQQHEQLSGNERNAMFNLNSSLLPIKFFFWSSNDEN